jgi:hypothetical protein
LSAHECPIDGADTVFPTIRARTGKHDAGVKRLRFRICRSVGWDLMGG